MQALYKKVVPQNSFRAIKGSELGYKTELPINGSEEKNASAQEKKVLYRTIFFRLKESGSVENLFFLRRTIFSSPKPFLGGSVLYPSPEPFYNGKGFCRTPFFSERRSSLTALDQCEFVLNT